MSHEIDVENLFNRIKILEHKVDILEKANLPNEAECRTECIHPPPYAYTADGKFCSICGKHLDFNYADPTKS